MINTGYNHIFSINLSKKIQEDYYMQIINNILTTCPCYKAGSKITPKGLMMHSVGVPQPTATVFVNQWKTSTNVCAHAVMGRDGKVYQVLPWNHRGWHAGAAANDRFISIELTEPNTIKYTSGASFTDSNPTATRAFVTDIYNQAVQFAAYICKTYKFNPLDSNQLLSHSEGYKKGLATNHADVEHLWSKFGFTMNQFRTDVNKAMGGSTGGTTELYRVRKSWADAQSQIGAYSSLANAKKIADANPGYSVFNSAGVKVYPTGSTSYTVIINTDVLNIRTGPGTGYALAGTVKRGEKFTIVGESNGWGQLKSGAGWISLDYTVRG